MIFLYFTVLIFVLLIISISHYINKKRNYVFLHQYKIYSNPYIYIFNGFYDIRINSIRILLVYNKESLDYIKCKIKYDKYYLKCNISLKIYPDKNSKYSNLLIHLNENKYPSKLLINNINIDIPL